MKLNARVVWIDVRASGLDPAADRLERLSVAVTDKELAVLAEAEDVSVDDPKEAEQVALAALEQEAVEELVEREMRSAVTREQAIQLILDSMQEGLLVCDLQGALVGTRSRAILEWFGSSEAFDRIWTYIAG